MMLYELALVEDRGSHWFVTNVTRNTLDNLAEEGETVLKLSANSFKIISDAINDGKAVHITKTRMASEVLPMEIEVLDHSETDSLDEARKAALIKVRMLVTPELAKISGFALYGFMMLNNDLANAGYFITNDNREEKYLAILETGNEELITKLEDYLNYKDEIESVAHLERKFSRFKKDIKVATTIEDVQGIQDRFLEKFYSNF